MEPIQKKEGLYFNMGKINRILALGMTLVSVCFVQATPVVQSSAPAKLTDKEFAAQLDVLIDNSAREDSFSGAVMVARDGQAIFEKAVGFANKETKQPNKTTTRFNLGSI